MLALVPLDKVLGIEAPPITLLDVPIGEHLRARGTAGAGHIGRCRAEVEGGKGPTKGAILLEIDDADGTGGLESFGELYEVPCTGHAGLHACTGGTGHCPTTVHEGLLGVVIRFHDAKVLLLFIVSIAKLQLIFIFANFFANFLQLFLHSALQGHPNGFLAVDYSFCIGKGDEPIPDPLPEIGPHPGPGNNDEHLPPPVLDTMDFTALIIIGIENLVCHIRIGHCSYTYTDNVEKSFTLAKLFAKKLLERTHEGTGGKGGKEVGSEVDEVRIDPEPRGHLVSLDVHRLRLHPELTGKGPGQPHRKPSTEEGLGGIPQQGQTHQDA